MEGSHNMQAVLYVGHGSRVKAGVEEAIRFIESSMAQIDVPIQEICFLELVDPSIGEGIAKCVARGATKIAVVPILLLTANHANEDIPLEIEMGKNKFPHVEFTYGKAFGIHPKIVDSLYDRIIEQKLVVNPNAHVLLVGRGSSDPAVRRDLSEIARLLAEKYAFHHVKVCFLYGTGHSFDEELQQLQQQAAHQQVFIIPYLLFSGMLMKSIEKKIAQYTSIEREIVLCESLGYHKNIQDVLIERVNELLE